MSRTNRSTAILATWPSVITILTTRNPNREKLHVEVVKFFLLIHTPHIRMDAASAADSNTTLELSELSHALANVHWYQNHPIKL